VTIYLSGAPENTPTMSMEGKVVRVTKEGTAIDFVSMDPDTYLHMRNLVLHNVMDPDQVEKEFTTSAFQDLPAEREN
jgi:DNA-directed RNA polymerase subunit E'/Rpb7